MVKRNSKKNKYFLGSLLKGATGLNNKLTDKFMGSNLGEALSGIGVTSGGLGGIANSVVNVTNGLMNPNGNETGVGNALSAVGSLASNIPGIGGIAGAAVNLVGGLVNSAFGSNINEEFVADTRANTSNQRNYVSNASDTSMLLSDWTNLDDMDYVTKKQVGTEGWLSNKATRLTQELNDNIKQANIDARLGFNNNIRNIANNTKYNYLANTAAFGGPLDFIGGAVDYELANTGLNNNRIDAFGDLKMTSLPNYGLFAEGGKIHIKPENRGKFTALKKRTGKSASWFKAHGTPAQKKMATFALNARKWKHDDGGYLEGFSTRKDIANRIRKEGIRRGLSENQINTLIEAGWRETTLGKYSNSAAHGIWQFDKPAGTYDKYLKYLKSNNLEDTIENQMGYLLDEYMPKRSSNMAPINGITSMPGDTYNTIWNNPNSTLEELVNYFIMDVESPKKREDENFRRRSIEAAKAISERNSKYNTYEDWFNTLPDNLRNTDHELYDLREAYNAGLNPVYNEDDGLFHLGSRNPVTGKIIKTYRHPTFWNSIMADMELGYTPYLKDGDIYTRTWKGNTSIESNEKALGGSLTHGGIFSNGVTTINTGGTHEQNPYEGIQMGVDNEGIPNLVEEGEIIWNDYVFSNRLKVPKRMKKNNKYKGLTFADVAKDIQKESEERPNDPISKNGLDAGLSKLAALQEGIRERRNNNRFDEGGSKRKLKSYSNFTPLTDDSFYTPEYMNFWNWINNNRDNAKAQKWLDRINNEEFGTVGGNKFNFDDIIRLAHDYKKGPVHNAFTEAAKMFATSPDNPNNIPTPPIIGGGLLDLEEELARDDEAFRNSITPYPMTPSVNYGRVKTSPLRYAPILGNAAGVFSDVFSKPDYSAADTVAGVDINPAVVGYTPVGNYLTYKPFDRDYYINKLNADSGATRRAIRNTSGGNRAAAMAGLLAANYNYGNQLGDLARQAEEYNQQQKERVEGFNRQTNLSNSEMGLRANMFNAESRNQATARRLQQAQTVAAMRQAAKDAYDRRRSNNINMFLTDLGNLGREITDRNWLDRLADSGVLKINTDGEFVITPKATKKNGGKLNKKKKGGWRYA